MQESDVVFRFLLSADENSANAVHSALCAFDDPPLRSEASLSFDRCGYFAMRRDMCREADLCQESARFSVIVAVGETHAWRLLGHGRRLFHDDAFDGSADRFHIVPVGSGHRQSDWHTMTFGRHVTLDACLAAIDWIGSGFPSRPTTLWSHLHLSQQMHVAHRPYSATPSRSLAVHRTGSPPPATVSETHPLVVIPETDRGLSSQDTTRSDPTPSTGSRCATQRRWRRHIHDPGDAPSSS